MTDAMVTRTFANSNLTAQVLVSNINPMEMREEQMYRNPRTNSVPSSLIVPRILTSKVQVANNRHT